MITKEELDRYLEAYNRGEPLISDEEKEIWKDISYRDIKLNMYQVSSYGRIRRKDTLKLMMPNIRDNGYVYVRLIIGMVVIVEYSQYIELLHIISVMVMI